jgi:hypothetical protein
LQQQIHRPALGKTTISSKETAVAYFLIIIRQSPRQQRNLRNHWILTTTSESLTKKESVLADQRVRRIRYPVLSTDFSKNRDITATVRCIFATRSASFRLTAE